jgi:hypothetical protein
MFELKMNLSFASNEKYPKNVTVSTSEFAKCLSKCHFDEKIQKMLFIKSIWQSQKFDKPSHHSCQGQTLKVTLHFLQ